MPETAYQKDTPLWLLTDNGVAYRLDGVQDMPADSDPPDGDFGLHFDPSAEITLTIHTHAGKRLWRFLIGWRTRGPVRMRMMGKAMKLYGKAERLQEA